MKDLVKFAYDGTKFALVVEINLVIIMVALLFLGLALWLPLRRVKTTKLAVRRLLPEIEFEIERNPENIQIANKIYIELITRKAAIPIEPDKDVIEEVYNSWYKLFEVTRDEIKSLPSSYLLDKCKATNKLIELTTMILNNGLRPHLTMYQAEFRRWYEFSKTEDANKDRSPQSIQKDFPKYNELIEDMERVNGILLEYAQELKKLIYNES